jgi:3-hydroxybutyryl-CoA dehydrogenase
MSITTVGIIGAGTMGNGIAQGVCRHRASTSSWSTFPRRPWQKGIATVASSLERLLKKEKISAADRDAALARIKGSDQLRRPQGRSQLVIEAATENHDLKLKILKQVDAIVGRPTSSSPPTPQVISITKLAAVDQPGRANSSACTFSTPCP